MRRGDGAQCGDGCAALSAPLAVNPDSGVVAWEGVELTLELTEPASAVRLELLYGRGQLGCAIPT